MYIVYFLGYPYRWKVELNEGWLVAGYCGPSECRMMIPGTYAEMHKEYD